MVDNTQQVVFISELNCNHCNTENRPVAKYCKNCGNKLYQKVFDENKLKNTLSKIYQTREASNEEKNEIRKRINEWANAIPNHPYRNLGSLIELKRVCEIPLYYAILFTQYESRRIEKADEPYYGQPYPKGKIDLHSYNVWENYNLIIYKDFVNHSETHPIEGTYEVYRCNYCLGVGEIPCKRCGGVGDVICSECKGKGVVVCSSCDGRRVVRCGYCYGEGRVRCGSCSNGKVIIGDTYTICSRCGGTGTVVCRYCNGLGYIPCSRCEGLGVISCFYCGGTGRVTCFDCGGDGKLICDVCDGKGEMLKYYYIKLDSYVKIEETKNTKDLPQELFLGNHLRLFGQPLEKYLSSAKVVIDICAEQIKQDIVDFIPHFELKENIKKIIQKVVSEENKSCYLDKHSGCRHVYQRLVIKQIPVFICEYNYSGNNYTMWIFCNNLSQVSIFSLKDPISEYEEQIMQVIETSVANNDFDNAWKNYVLLEEMSNDLLKLNKLASTIVSNEIKHKNLVVENFNNYKGILNKTDEYFCSVAKIVKKTEVIIEVARVIEETIYMKYFTLIEKSGRKTKIIVDACKHYFNQLKNIFSSFNGKDIFDLAKEKLGLPKKINSMIDKLFDINKYHTVFQLAKLSCNILSYFPKNAEKLNEVIDTTFKKLKTIGVIFTLTICVFFVVFLQYLLPYLVKLLVTTIEPYIIFTPLGVLATIVFLFPGVWFLMTGLSKFIYILPQKVYDNTKLIFINSVTTIITTAILIGTLLVLYSDCIYIIYEENDFIECIAIFILIFNLIGLTIGGCLSAGASSIKNKFKEKISKGVC